MARGLLAPRAAACLARRALAPPPVRALHRATRLRRPIGHHRRGGRWHEASTFLHRGLGRRQHRAGRRQRARRAGHHRRLHHQPRRAPTRWRVRMVGAPPEHGSRSLHRLLDRPGLGTDCGALRAHRCGLPRRRHHADPDRRHGDPPRVGRGEQRGGCRTRSPGHPLDAHPRADGGPLAQPAHRVAGDARRLGRHDTSRWHARGTRRGRQHDHPEHHQPVGHRLRRNVLLRRQWRADAAQRIPRRRGLCRRCKLRGVQPRPAPAEPPFVDRQCRRHGRGRRYEPPAGGSFRRVDGRQERRHRSGDRLLRPRRRQRVRDRAGLGRHRIRRVQRGRPTVHVHLHPAPGLRRRHRDHLHRVGW